MKFKSALKATTAAAFFLLATVGMPLPAKTDTHTPTQRSFAIDKPAMDGGTHTHGSLTEDTDGRWSDTEVHWP